MNNLLTHSSRILSPSFFDDLFFKDFEDVFLPLPSIKKIEYPVDIYENDGGLVIDIAAIGLEKSDIKIEMEEDILSVSHQKAKTETEDKDNYAYRGIARRAFKLSWRIPEQFDMNKTKASLDKGLLKIIVPKSDIEKKPCKVEVQIQ